MVAVAKASRAEAGFAVRVGPAIDLEHLARMTLGERSLEREVLALFDRQAEMLLPRIRRGAPAVAAASAHTLKGSALGIGAFRVARAAEAVEQADRARRLAAAIEALGAGHRRDRSRDRAAAADCPEPSLKAAGLRGMQRRIWRALARARPTR